MARHPDAVAVANCAPAFEIGSGRAGEKLETELARVLRGQSKDHRVRCRRVAQRGVIPRNIISADVEIVRESATVDKLFVIKPGSKALPNRFPIAPRTIQQNPAAIAQDELRLPR